MCSPGVVGHCASPSRRSIVTNARDVRSVRARLSARDALHVARKRKRHGIERVMSFDAAFDAVGWIERRTERQ